MTGASEIVVGLDGSGTSAATLDYAVRLAQEEQRPLHLVHIAPAIGPFPPLSILAGDRILGHAAALLADLVRRARLAAPDLQIRSTLGFGPRKSELAKAANHAAALVLGRHEPSEARGLPTGSTAAALSAALHCPVRVVPSDWRTRRHGNDVVVAIKQLTGSESLIARGLQLAARSGGVLILVHAWYLPAGYEGMLTPEEVSARSAHAAVELEHTITDLRLQWPDVAVQTKVQLGQPEQVLAELSAKASLLLVGRPEHAPVFGHLGRTARALLQCSTAPVELGPRVLAGRTRPDGAVADAAADIGADIGADGTLERGGALLR
jgi:nucleotide-binding universal stress UspA family protein